MTEQIILVRHGETVLNVAGIAQGWGDSALSERGAAQVGALAERLKTYGADAIFSSPLNRALTTAERIREATGLDIRIIEDLREMNYGAWEGQKFLDVRQKDEESYRRWIEESDFACPGGESHQQVYERMRRALSAVNGSRRPIIVAHGTAIRIAATALIDFPVSAARHFAQDNAALNVFVRRNERWVIKAWNDTTHCMNLEG